MMNEKLKVTEPLVSIIMTCYNSDNTLQDALSSIINQSYKNWELIFVDDGSTDQSLKIVNHIIDKRIKIFSLDKNYGRGTSYQKGINEAKGEFIMFLDSDDWWYSQKIEKQINYLIINDDTNFVGSGLITAENYEPLGVRCNKIISKKISKGIADPPLAFATICIRSNIMSKYKFDQRLVIAQDADLLRTLCMHEVFSNLDNILYVYNESASFNWDKMKNSLKNTKIGLKRHKKKFLLNYYIGILKINFKIIFYYILFSLKFENLLLNFRNNTISAENLEFFEKEKKLMLKTKSTVFKNL